MKSRLFSSYLNNFVCLKPVPQVLVVIDVTQLVANNSRIANHGVDVRMRMPVYPQINATVSNEIAEFCRESPIQHRAFVLWSHRRQRRQMMCNHNDVLGRTFLDSLLQETQTFLMLQVEIIGRKAMAIIQNLSEVVHPPMHMKHVHLRNPRQGCRWSRAYPPCSSTNRAATRHGPRCPPCRNTGAWVNA